MSTTTAIGGASRTHEPSLDDDPPALKKAGSRTAPAEIARGAVSAKIDADLAAFVSNVLDPKPTPKNDDILYLGINEYSAKNESDALAQTGVRLHRVGVAPEGVHDPHAFVASLGLPPDVAKNVERVIAGASERDRGPLAEIAKVWASAERGGTCPSRFVISGHSGDGDDIYGGFSGVHISQVHKLAKAMPHAASQIEDVHISACSSYGNATAPGPWREAFPNAKSIWSYNGMAPSPATGHLVAWAQMTKGRGELPRIDDSLAQAKVATWTKSRGFEDRGTPMPTLVAQVKDARDRFDLWMNGSAVAQPHRNAAENDFRALIDYANRPGVAADDKARASREAACLLRLRYYGNVRSEFAARDAKAINDGFRSLGLAVPDFAKLSRQDALAAIARFETEASRRSPMPTACLVLAPRLRGFASLDRNVIPNQWCQ